MERENAWKSYDKKTLDKVNNFADDYKIFISENKTERECVKTSVALAESKGYKNLNDIVLKNSGIKAGDKIYFTFMEKAIVLFNIGKEPLENGMNILGAHIDSPRLDIKQNPLYEDTGFAYLDTHYYGGIKKYQWVATPLAIHGVVIKKDGTKIEINIGEKDDDPVFGISDLLIHLSEELLEKKAKVVVEGEDLNLLIGNIPTKAEKNPVKENILKLLKDNYNIDEEDFLSSELEIVPAGKARDFGLDRSMIMGYGHDDRVCSYPSLISLLESKNLKRTGVCILVDKEEIGSYGATGMQSKFFENAVAEIIAQTGVYSDLILRRALSNSKMLSSDVNSGFDPIYASAYEKNNSSYLGKGVVFSKYTGARGKSGSSDANAEYMAELRKIMDDNKVYFQTAELGKVDLGGGGTIAYIMAHYGMEVIDCGIAVLNMHAPWEIIDKADLYETLKCYRAFLKDAYS